MIMDEVAANKGGKNVYSCWKITGNFNYAMESCANQNLGRCPDLEPYIKCPMGHQVLF